MGSEERGVCMGLSVCLSLRLEESIDCALMKIILYRGGDYGVVGFRVMNCVGHR